MRNDAFAGPVTQVDNSRTSWSSSKLAPSSITRVRCALQGQQPHVCALKRQIRPNLKKRMESLTEGCFLLSAVPRLFQDISYFGVDGPRRGRRERAGSSHSSRTSSGGGGAQASPWQHKKGQPVVAASLLYHQVHFSMSSVSLIWIPIESHL